MKRLLIILFITLCLCPAGAWGATYYVTQAGAGAKDGSYAAPYDEATFEALGDVCDGNTYYIMDTWVSNLGIVIPDGGANEGTRVYIRGDYPGRECTITNWITVTTWAADGGSYKATVTDEPIVVKYTDSSATTYNDTFLTLDDDAGNAVASGEFDLHDGNDELFLNVGEDPDDGTVITPGINHIIQVDSKDYVDIIGFDLEATNELYRGISLINCTYCRAINNTVRYCGYGIASVSSSASDDYNTIRGNTATDCFYGIYINRSGKNTVSGNILNQSDNLYDKVFARGAVYACIKLEGESDNNLIDSNKSIQYFGDGIVLKNSDSNTIVNNIVAFQKGAYLISAASINNLIYLNVGYDVIDPDHGTTRANSGFDGGSAPTYNDSLFKVRDPGTTGNVFINNIGYERDDSTYNQYPFSASQTPESGNSANYNCWYRTESGDSNVISWSATDEMWGEETWSEWQARAKYDLNSITADPLFVNAGGSNSWDYKLRSGSPAIGVATTGGSIPTTDFYGHTRTRKTLGSIEYTKEASEAINGGGFF